MGRHYPECECGARLCKQALAYEPHNRRHVLGRFETLLAMRGAVVQVSMIFARVEADGQVLILRLTQAVLGLLSAADRMPRLEFGVIPRLCRVTGERDRRTVNQ